MLRTALALLLLAATVASAEVPDDWKKIRSVLRDFDYEVEKQDDWVTATHDDYLNMFVKGYKSGILLQAYFKTSEMDVSENDIRKLNNKLSLNATNSASMRRPPASTSTVMAISCARPGSRENSTRNGSRPSSRPGTPTPVV